jgi:signal transduction histidine kinase
LVIQLTLIGLVAVLGTFAAAWVIEEVLVRQALEDEASHFWGLTDARGLDVATPDTRNLRGVLVRRGESPTIAEDVSDLPPGVHERSSSADLSIVHISERDGHRLYLFFDGIRVKELSMMFGLVPLALILAALYITAWIAFRLSKRAISPIERLSRQIASLDPNDLESFELSIDDVPPDADSEVRTLSGAVIRLVDRIQKFVDRERMFTRDASHELRSPMTVIRLAADMMRGDDNLTPLQHKSVERMRRAVTDMEELTNAFLILARESDSGIVTGVVSVNAVVDEELSQVKQVFSKPIETQIQADGQLLVESSEKVLSVLIGNLLRNAFSYTDTGTISVHIGSNFVCVADNGPGISKSDIDQIFRPFFRGSAGGEGYGVGLSIVKRLVDRFDWRLEVESEEGEGTAFTVRFPRPLTS